MVSEVSIGGLILTKRLACLFPIVAGGRFSMKRPSPCASKGTTVVTKERSTNPQITDRILLL